MEFRDTRKVSQLIKRDIMGLYHFLIGHGWSVERLERVLGIRKSTLYRWGYEGRISGIFTPIDQRGEDRSGKGKIRGKSETVYITGKGNRVVYLCGAISGRDLEEVKEEFKEAERRLFSLGMTVKVLNPFDNGLKDTDPWRLHMRADIKLLMDSGYIYIVNNIAKSKGGKMEYRLAVDLGIKVMSYRDSDEKLKEVIGGIGEQ